MVEDTHDDLVQDLRLLGRSVESRTPSEGLTTAVMNRVAAMPTPARPVSAWTRMWRQARSRGATMVQSRRRRIALVVGAVLLVVLATPPVRAAVEDWFGFGGVLVERGSPVRGDASPPPEAAQDRSVTEAAASVDFTLSLPEELGAPGGVEVSPDGRLVSMSWTSEEDGVVRLDQFDAMLDFTVLKRTPGVFYVAVAGGDGLWFEEPHEVVLLEPDGSRRTESARLAGHTLIWLDDDTTLRLEGELSLERAVEIAESSVPVD